MRASEGMAGAEIGKPVVDLGLAMTAVEPGDLRLLIEGIVVVMGGRDLLEDAAVKTMKLVPLAGRNKEGVADAHRGAGAVLDDLEIAVEELEGLLLLLVEVIGVLLPRQLDDQLLGILPIDAGDDDGAIFAEAPQAEMVRDLDLGILVDVDVGLVQHAADLQHDLVDELLVADALPGEARRQGGVAGVVAVGDKALAPIAAEHLPVLHR